ACGIPCVVTRFSSAEEMVKEGENGFIVKSRDEQEFAQRMLDALQLDRNHVIEFDQQFEKYAISHLKEDLLRVLEN
ncbi:MAG: glycosyltransferase family 4 protein, partial [Bacteroidaceae bacterium]|nr:glycosyltransferase family 4 protein [Bacteroidaceae bacterium]